MSYSSITIANHFIKNSVREDNILTHVKLMGLVYLAQGWHLGFFNKPLINEKIIIGHYNPYFIKLAVKIKNMQLIRNKIINIPALFGFQRLNKDTKNFLDIVWDNYKKLSSVELMLMITQKSTPWRISKSLNHNIVNESLIHTYFKNTIDTLDENVLFEPKQEILDYLKKF